MTRGSEDCVRVGLDWSLGLHLQIQIQIELEIKIEIKVERKVFIGWMTSLL